MDKWENIAEQKIREAMAEGAFANLKGTGKPLDLEEDPYEDPSMRMAHRLLRNNGFAPPWIEEAKDLERAIDTLRRDLKRARDHGRALDMFHEKVAELNRRILTHNLKTPSVQFHMQTLKAEDI
jgi:hypothetical protein